VLDGACFLLDVLDSSFINLLDRQFDGHLFGNVAIFGDVDIAHNRLAFILESTLIITGIFFLIL